MNRNFQSSKEGGEFIKGVYVKIHIFHIRIIHPIYKQLDNQKSMIN